MKLNFHFAKLCSVILVILFIDSCQDVNVDELDATIVDIDTVDSDSVDSLAIITVDSLAIRIDLIDSTLTAINKLISELQNDGKLNAEEALQFFDQIESLEQRLGATDADIDEIETETAELMGVVTELMENDTFQTISGRVEKGSFVKGSILFINELDSNLAQTGRSFNTLITDNLGSFELKVKNLKGKFCRVLADGFFYHEVLNRNSTSRIALTGLVKIDSGEIINVNILTHLEQPRVEHLLEQGIPYDSAKEQALTEVLNAFGITSPGISRSEKVTLIGPNEKNNILLALSTLIVGFRTESEITELKLKIKTCSLG